MLKGILTGLIAVMMVGVAAAGPFDDGNDAYRRGDYAAALSLLRPLAEQGVADAQLTLGDIYANGESVPQDFAEAMKWYQLAAEQGNAGGQLSLGSMYLEGDGVPTDYVLAHMWLNLAAARVQYPAMRDFYAKMRDKVAGFMTLDQINEAQRLAREWRPKTQP